MAKMTTEKTIALLSRLGKVTVEPSYGFKAGRRKAPQFTLKVEGGSVTNIALSNAYRAADRIPENRDTNERNRISRMKPEVFEQFKDWRRSIEATAPTVAKAARAAFALATAEGHIVERTWENTGISWGDSSYPESEFVKLDEKDGSWKKIPRPPELL